MGTFEEDTKNSITNGPYIFTGWVERVYEKNQFGREVVIRSSNDPANAKWTQYITFIIPVKKIDMFDTINLDSKVKVEFYLNGVIGVSRAGKNYRINKLILNRVAVIQPGVERLGDYRLETKQTDQRPERDTVIPHQYNPQPQQKVNEDNLPF